MDGPEMQLYNNNNYYSIENNSSGGNRVNAFRLDALLMSILLLTSAPFIVLGSEDKNEGPPLVTLEEALGIIDDAQVGGFVENIGQWDDELLFVARTDFGHIGLSSDGIYYNIIEKDRRVMTKMDARDRLKDRSREDETITGSVIKVRFEGSNLVEPVGDEELPRISNFYLGNDETRWVSGTRSFERVEYPGIWDGVSIVFRSGEEGLKYDIVLEPLAEASDIILGVQGHDSIEVMDTNLVIDTPAGIPLMDSGLMAFYSDGNGEEVGVKFHVLDENRYTFSFEERDPERGVVIDPLVYSTYVGGFNDDIYYDIDLDTNGNIFAVGFSDSTNFPTTIGAYQTSNNGGLDVVVSQINSGATSLVYSTYVGGSDEDISQGIRIDSSGNAYVTGGTASLDFPTSDTAYNKTHWNTTMYFDVFVFRLDSRGSSLAYSTYVAGEEDDAGLSIDIDGSGNAYVVGFSYSANFPTTSGAYDTTHNDYADVILFELSPKGDSLTYSTFFGGNDDDIGNDMIYNNGDVFLTGSSWSYDFPTTSGAFQTTHVDWTDVIVMKFNIGSSSLTYSTFVGGDDEEEGYSIAMDSSENVYVTGYTWGGMRMMFPTTSGAYDTTLGGTIDSFIFKLNSLGSALTYSTFIGGSNDEYGNCIDVDPSGNAYITGYTYSTDYPTTPGTDYPTFRGGDVDGFATVLNNAGSALKYSSFLGGSADDLGYSILVDDDLEAYVSGQTDSKNFPTTSGVISTTLSGIYDAFLTKLNFTLPPGIPRNLALKVGDGFMETSWIPPLSDGGSSIIRYSVYRRTEGGSTGLLSNVTELKYNDTSIEFGVSYYYSVSATNEVAEGPISNEVSGKSITVPDAPIDLEAVVKVGQVDLSWEAPAFKGGTFLTGYKVYRGADIDNMEHIQDINPFSTSHVDEDVVPGQTYYYHVTALNDKGESSPCDHVSVVTHDVPSSPRNLSVRAGDKFAEISWDEPESNGGAPVTRYVIYRGPGDEVLQLLRSVPATEFNHNDTTVSNGLNYTYAVAAENDVGLSLRSLNVTAFPMTFSSPPRVLEPQSGDGSVTLGWEAPTNTGGSPIVRYGVYGGTSSEEKSLLAEVDADVFEFIHSDLTNGQTYYYHITARNGRGWSAPSNEVEATPLGLPDPPTDLEVRAGDGFVIVSWIAPLDDGGTPVVNYHVFRSSGTSDPQLLFTTNKITINDTEVTNGEVYFYSVSALTAIGGSIRSDEISATPLGLPDPPTEFSLEAGDGTIGVSWGPPEDDGGTPVTGYVLQKSTDGQNFELLSELAPEVFFHSDKDVENGVTYHYRMLSVNELGPSVMTGILTAKPLGFPSSPGNVRAEEKDGAIIITWELPEEDGGTPVSKFHILRSVDGGDFKLIGNVDGQTTTYTDINVVEGIEYAYMIKAETEAGQGESSTSVIVKMKEPSEGGSLGSIIGIIIAVVVLLILAALIVFFIMKSRKKEVVEQQGAASEMPPGAPGLAPGTSTMPQLPPQQYQQMQGYGYEQQAGLPPAQTQQQGYEQPRDQYYGDVYQGSMEQQGGYQEQADYGYSDQQFQGPPAEEAPLEPPAEQITEQPQEQVPEPAPDGGGPAPQ